MTTISPNRHRRTLGPGTLLLLALFVVCALGVTIWRAQAGSLFWQVASPLMAFRNNVGETNASLLHAQLASSTAALADRNALYNENLQLKQLLGRTVSNHAILAAVLQRPPGIPYDTLLIDIGTQSGITPGSLVFAGGTSAIGTVSDVYDTTSRVALFSAPGESYDALLRGSIPLTLTGQGAGSMSGEVPADTPVVAGDPVMLPGIASAFVGQVSYVQQESGASFTTLYVQLPVNLFSLQYVEVQTP